MDLSVLTPGEKKVFDFYQKELKKDPSFKKSYVKQSGFNPATLHHGLKKLGMIAPKNPYRKSKMMTLDVAQEKPLVALIGNESQIASMIKELVK